VNKVTIITYPDYFHDQSNKVLIVNATADERNSINEFLLKYDIEITLYLYNNNDQVEWLLNVANQVNNVYINVDNSNDMSYYYMSYLVSLTNTTWNSHKIDYSIINKGKVSNINDYMARYWLD